MEILPEFRSKEFSSYRGEKSEQLKLPSSSEESYEKTDGDTEGGSD